MSYVLSDQQTMNEIRSLFACRKLTIESFRPWIVLLRSTRETRESLRRCVQPEQLARLQCVQRCFTAFNNSNDRDYGKCVFYLSAAYLRISHVIAYLNTQLRTGWQVWNNCVESMLHRQKICNKQKKYNMLAILSKDTQCGSQNATYLSRVHKP